VAFGVEGFGSLSNTSLNTSPHGLKTRVTRRIPLGICLWLLIFSGGCAPTSPQLTERSDWVELTSGEWLKGRIKSMQDWELEIDSDKLHDVSIEWYDVKQVFMRQGTVLYGKAQTARGAVHVDDKNVTVDGPTPVKIPREDLLGLSAGGRERNYWTGSFDMGLTYRSGNTNQTEVTAQADFRRRTAASRFDINFNSNYDVTSGAKTTDNDRLRISYDHLLTPTVFIRPFNGQYYRDVPLNIEHQATVSAGAGYLFFDQPKLEWDVYAGPAYQYTNFVGTQSGTAGEASTVAAVFQTNFKKKKLFRDVDILIDWQGILTSRDAGLFTQQLDATIRFKITHLLHLDLSLLWNRTEQPKPDSSGKTPKRDDIQTVVTFGFEF